MACLSAKNNPNTSSQTLYYDKATYHMRSSAVCTGWGLWSLTRKTGNEKWKVGHGRMRPGKRMHSPSLTSTGPNLWSSFTFWTQCLAASWLPEASEAHSPDTKWDLIGRDRKCKHHRLCGQVGWDGGRECTNKIVLVRNMQGVLKRLTSCQEKVLGFVTGTNLAWQGSDSLAVADRSRQV